MEPLARAFHALLPLRHWPAALRSLAQPTPPLPRSPVQGRVAPTSDPGIVSHADATDPVVCHGSDFPSAACAVSAVKQDRVCSDREWG